MTKDMTKGNPMKLIVGFALPLLFGFLFQQFYNLVDTVIVRRLFSISQLKTGRQ
jgi:Na+-driven multidrug efflux pump